MRSSLSGNQGLLVYPLVLAAIQALLLLPASFVPPGDAFWRWCRNLVSVETRLDDAGTTEIVWIVAGLLVGSLAGAWLIGAFIRSVGEGRRVRWPGTRPFLRLAVVYVLGSGIIIGLGLAAGSAGAAGIVTLPLLLVVVGFTLFADYAIVLGERTVVGGLRASLRVIRRGPGRALLAFVGINVAGQLVTVVVEAQLDRATSVFAAFPLSIVLALGLLSYVSNCILLALYQEAEEAGALADAPAEATA